MREIKFRAWANGKMISWEEICSSKYFKDFFLLKYMTNPPRRVSVLLQYTGLKDKNGREIYEGDILRLTYSGVSYKKEVVFTDCAFMIKGGAINSHERFPLKNQMEVIGNVFENPELT